MARRKRSEKAAITVAKEKAKPRRRVALPQAPAKESLQAFCPVCGKMIVDRAVKAKYITLETVPYFEAIEWDPKKPFGVALSVAGRGSFSNWRYIDPDEAPELFEGLRQRILQAMKEWRDKGWISSDEIENI